MQHRRFSAAHFAAMAALAGAASAYAQVLSIRPVATPTPEPVHLENPTVGSGPRPDVISGHEDILVHVTSRAGKVHRLLAYTNLDAHCAPTSPEARVLREPTSGKLTIARVTLTRRDFGGGAWWGRLPADDPRSSCRVRSEPAMAIDYAPDKGFSGRDTAQVNIMDHGHVTRLGFVIDVA